MTAAADPALPLDGQPDELAIQRAGLAAIRSGQHLTPIELGVAADVDPMRAQAIIDGLLGRQAATVSGGRVDGIAGLTTRPTKHKSWMPCLIGPFSGLLILLSAQGFPNRLCINWSMRC